MKEKVKNTQKAIVRKTGNSTFKELGVRSGGYECVVQVGLEVRRCARDVIL